VAKPYSNYPPKGTIAVCGGLIISAPLIKAMINMENITAVAENERAGAPRGDRYPSVSSGVFGNGVSPEEIQRELHRIIESKDFPASERNRRVLQYVVRCGLEGRESEITAHAIATRVYGRPETFNSLRDPIVRIEMARLRRDLEMYYLKSGASSPLRLGIPKGRYLPQVTRVARSGGGSAAGSVAASPFLVSVLRASLRAWSGAPDAAAAWQDLLLADPDLLANLHGAVHREVADKEVTDLIVEGVLRAARRTT